MRNLRRTPSCSKVISRQSPFIYNLKEKYKKDKIFFTIKIIVTTNVCRKEWRLVSILIFFIKETVWCEKISPSSLYKRCGQPSAVKQSSIDIKEPNKIWKRVANILTGKNWCQDWCFFFITKKRHSIFLKTFNCLSWNVFPIFKVTITFFFFYAKLKYFKQLNKTYFIIFNILGLDFSFNKS